MKAWSAIRSLGPIDLRSVRRDSLLSWMVFMPLFLGVFIRLAVPPLRNRLLELLGFDLAPYYPVIISYFLIMLTPMVFGMLIGFLLLDERDDDTLQALQVTPLTMSAYLAYRLAVPMLLSVAMIFVIFPLAGLVRMAAGPLLLVAVVAAPIAPLIALFLASFAENKVEGFALVKAVGGVLVLPVVAYFLPGNWELLFGVMPTYWAIKVFWLLDAGRTGVWIFALTGLIYQAVLVSLLRRRFQKVLHR
ncbi:MAG: hypothetical protein ACLFWD_07270 [Anaerolineales bacterium]